MPRSAIACITVHSPAQRAAVNRFCRQRRLELAWMGANSRAKAAQDFAETLRSHIMPAVYDLSRTIAAHLNLQGIGTASGSTWSSQAALRLIARLTSLSLTKTARIRSALGEQSRRNNAGDET